MTHDAPDIIFNAKGLVTVQLSALSFFYSESAPVQIVCSSMMLRMLCLVYSSHEMVKGEKQPHGTDAICIAAESWSWLAGCIFDLQSLTLMLLHYCHCSTTGTGTFYHEKTALAILLKEGNTTDKLHLSQHVHVTDAVKLHFLRLTGSCHVHLHSHLVAEGLASHHVSQTSCTHPSSHTSLHLV